MENRIKRNNAIVDYFFQDENLEEFMSEKEEALEDIIEENYNLLKDYQLISSKKELSDLSKGDYLIIFDYNKNKTIEGELLDIKTMIFDEEKDYYLYIKNKKIVFSTHIIFFKSNLKKFDISSKFISSKEFKK